MARARSAQFYRHFRNAFSDFRVTIEDVLAEADKTAIRLTFTGRHTGDGLGVPPIGRTFQSTAIVIMRWQNGQIVEAWNEFDAAGMMGQLSGAGTWMKMRASLPSPINHSRGGDRRKACHKRSGPMIQQATAATHGHGPGSLP